jgi:hypothetical protein
MTAVLVLVGGLCLTLVLAWAAGDAANRNNKALLDLQVRQTVAAVAAAIPTSQAQLSDALTVASATGSSTTFTKFVQHRGLPKGVVSESLWERGPSGGPVLLANIGKQPTLATEGSAAAFIGRARSNTQLTVTRILPGEPRRLGYALASGKNPDYIVYAETALPPRTKLRVPANSPFSDLNYAIYLGSGQHASDLVEASVPTPIHGISATASAPFGNTSITVVGTPKGWLVGWLSTALPWIVLAAGTVLSVVSAATVEYVGRRRRRAEELSEELGELYAQQRSIATELQHALLPQKLPMIEGVEIAGRYLPGSKGVDVGGDWYDVIELERDRFVLIVGDVSGRGIPAASVMASLRFSSRAFASYGMSPAEVLANLSKTLEIGTDGHFATALCMAVDVTHRRVEIASAGHLPPVIREKGRTYVPDVASAPPIGVGWSDDVCRSTCLQLGDGATILAYTDGLVERRGECIDDSIERLRKAVEHGPNSVDVLVPDLIADLTEDLSTDDAVLIGVAWTN